MDLLKELVGLNLNVSKGPEILGLEWTFNNFQLETITILTPGKEKPPARRDRFLGPLY